MGEIDISAKPNKLQKWVMNRCKAVYGDIGNLTFLRCKSCHKIVTANKILASGDCACGYRVFSPSNLSLFEELYYVGRALWTKKPLQ